MGVERELTAHVKAIVDGIGRDAAWHRLLAYLAPRLEEWTRRNHLLARVQLAGEDDVRAVLVNVLTRLKADDFANLRKFLAAAAPPEDELLEAAAVERLGRVAAIDVETEDAGEDASVGTPLRAWLLTLLRFAVKDHVKQRLGWGVTGRLIVRLAGARDLPRALPIARALAGVTAAAIEDGALAVDYLPSLVSRLELARGLEAAGFEVEVERAPQKRDVHTGARAFGPEHEGSSRPPVTDWLTVAKLAEDAREFMTTFPSPMREAVELWLADHDFDEIAARLALAPEGGRAPAERARALVRAGQARLRERFRDERASYTSEVG